MRSPISRKQRGGEKVKREKERILESESCREKHEETEKLIYEEIEKKCHQPGDNAKEIYLLSLALKELNQLEPTKQ